MRLHCVADRGRRLLVAAISVLAFIVAVSPASGSTPRRWHLVRGHAVVMPSTRSHLRSPTSEGSAGAGARPRFGPLNASPGPADIEACNPIPPAAKEECNLTYHKGSVMRTNRTHLVFWAPKGFSFPAGYQALLERYLTDVAHDSGDQTFSDSVATQYFDEEGGKHNIQTESTFAGALTDTNEYPGSEKTCESLEGSATACLTEEQEIAQLDSFVNEKGGPRGTGDLWFLVLPPSVQTCFTSYSWCGPYGEGKSGNEYCAYHNSFTGGFGGSTPTVWANMVYAPADGCPNQRPNNNSADVTIDVLSHEMNEAITNPTGSGWFDESTTNGGEIGDQCNFIYGEPIGSTASGEYDELINGNPYRVQQEWSNAITGCAMNFGAVAPTASFTFSPSSPKALQSVKFDGTGSHSNNSGGSIVKYTWEFGDGGSGSGATPEHSYATEGTYTVKLTVQDSSGLTASTSENVTVTTRGTTLTYTGATNGEYNDEVTLSATLKDEESSSGVEGKEVKLTLGEESCTATTQASGNASCAVTAKDTPGPYTVAATFAGDSVYAASSTSALFTLEREESQLAYTGALTTAYHDPVTVSAKLTDPEGGAAIAGKEVKLAIGSGGACTATTTEEGVASCSITPTVTGTQTVTAEFAGDADYEGSSTSRSFSITPEETTMTYTGPTTILSGASGATLTAKLVEDGANDNDGDGGSPGPVPAESVTLSLGSQSCTGTTEPSGDVSCTIPSVTVPLGPETIGAAFTGDAYYLASSASTTAIVFAFPSRGAFTLGDKTVAAATPGATTVTWWADTWSTLDSLSLGGAPPSFKGFAGTVSLPTTTPPMACAGDWATLPGNSPPPATGVPSYMGVLVASKVTKSGSRIAGNAVSIVVVKVDPGYAPNPSGHGTGVIVATYC